MERAQPRLDARGQFPFGAVTGLNEYLKRLEVGANEMLQIAHQEGVAGMEGFHFNLSSTHAPAKPPGTMDEAMRDSGDDGRRWFLDPEELAAENSDGIL